MKHRIFVVCFVMAIALVSSASAQDRRPSVLSGVITDSFGSLIPDVYVYASANNGKRFQTKSGSKGSYNLRIAEGIYSLKFVRLPFSSFEIERYQVPGNGEMHLDVSLICEDCKVVDDHFTK